MEKNVACTIVSNNYISYARTLGDSLKKKNADLDFYILIVDKYMGEIKQYTGNHTLIKLEDLQIEDLRSKTFTFDVLELNTNVKATFLKYLLKTKKYNKVLYFDPDIYVYQSIAYLYDLLDQYTCVLTPHITSPYPQDKMHPDERELLSTGVFNLGFLGISSREAGLNFLDWWERMCLKIGFNETRNGLFVDQKFVDLLPCFVDDFFVLKDHAYNMAYWNLHERVLSKVDGEYVVSGGDKLAFYHFSGFDVNRPEIISKYQRRFDFANRTDLKEIFLQYREMLISNGVNESRKIEYFYSKFLTGEPIPLIARRLYSVYNDEFKNDNPFDKTGRFCLWMRSQGIKSQLDSSAKYNTSTYNKDDYKLKILHCVFKLVLKCFGTDRYSLLMKYFSYISIFRNQREIFKLDKGR